MKKYEYTRQAVIDLVKASGLSNRRFCKAVGLNRGDFYRLVYRNKELSEKNQQKIHKYAQRRGMEFIAKKSLFKRIVEVFTK